MTTMLSIRNVIGDCGLSVDEKVERVIGLLAAEPDQGRVAAVECLLSTNDELVASYVAGYLAIVPDEQGGKRRVVERLADAGPLVGAASLLVPWIPEALTERLIADYLEEPSPSSPLFPVIFEIATFWPERLRPHGGQLDHPSLSRGMRSGASDETVSALVARWRQEQDLEDLDELARVRTPRAAGALVAMRDEVDDPEVWERFVHMAGYLPDRGEPSAHGSAFMGFVVDRGLSPHEMGGRFGGDVPLCPTCGTPTERVLTLSAAALPFALTRDPSFFWYTCGCGALDFTAAQFQGSGLRAFYTLAGGPSRGGRLIPGERALLLEPHPNQSGVSIDATGGFGRHQVGGLPRWIEPAAHPVCPGCGKRMKFLASIDSGPSSYGQVLVDGTLYGFWCDPCAVSFVRHQG